ncbi:ribonuclease VapC [Fibrobacterales bacterium]|nr:ribonuclease VapC [Fibrobacterales bacterium]
MKFLLDTNVISEIRKRRCHPAVRRIINNIDSENLFLSVVSIGEIKRGIQKLDSSSKKTEISLWLSKQLPEWFGERILPLDFDVMVRWGELCTSHNRTLTVLDSLIVATVLAHGMTLITRNTKDFEGIGGLPLLNPWES